MVPLDLKRLAAEVSAEHKIRVDPDDPVMAVVTLSRMVLDHAAGEVLQRFQTAARDFESAYEKVQLRAGSALAQEVKDCSAAIKREALLLAKEARSCQSTSENGSIVRRTGWFVVGLLSAIFLLVLGIAIGTRLR